MRYLKHFLFVILILIRYCDLKAGVVIHDSQLSMAVLKENYKYYVGSQNPDIVEACFFEGVAMDSAYYNRYNNGLTNKKYIDFQIKKNNILFFRCLYKNPSGVVYKYVDISVKGGVSAEADLLDPINKIIEIQRFYQSGAALSRIQYIYLYKNSKGEILGDSLWYALIKPNLIKQGKEKIYYSNNALRVEKQYQYGIIKDTLYNEFYPDGKIYKTYSIKNGHLNGPYKVFNKKNVVIEDDTYDEGRIIKTITKAPAGSSNKKAFLFGSGKFAPNSGWNNISAGSDIELLKHTLANTGYGGENIFAVSDSIPSKTGLISSFQQFIKLVKKGDIVFVHFSGNAQFYRESDTAKSILIIPLYNSKISVGDSTSTIKGGIFLKNRKIGNLPYQEVLENYLTEQDLQDFLNSLKSTIGTTGQLYVSLDVSHAGALLSGIDTSSVKSYKGTFRGEKNDLLFNLAKQTGAPTFIYTATQKDEEDYEYFDHTNRISYGSLSYALAKNIGNPLVQNTQELYEAVRDSVKRYTDYRQTPGYLGIETQFLFENNDNALLDKSNGLPVIKSSGNAFVLSVGISQYNDSAKAQLSFKNSTNDAASYTAYFTNQFKDLTSGTVGDKLTSVLLQDQTATKEKILEAINNAISSTKPDDYFIFNFSGYCKPLPDSTGKMSTWFVPYGLADINDDKEIREKGISLEQLRGLLQFIPANNQLFITEAGATKDFQREFIRALIETSPKIATLSPKNRIFIVPTSSGFDNCNCNNITIEHGPINYYLTNLNADLNVFGLFDGGVYADAIKFDLFKTEAGCNYFRTGYFDVFFEKDFVNDLKYYLPEDVMQSRGTKLLEEDRKAVASSVSNKYALVIGIDHYEGKPNWPDLDNPFFDASEIASSLKKNFGFNVTLIPDADAVTDSIYEHILKLSKQLKPTDQVLIYIAGHGDFDDKLFDDGFIVCRNSKPVKQDPYRNTYIQYSKLSRMINKLPAQQVMMILDVCFGGTFDERVARNKSRGGTDTYADRSDQSIFEIKMKKKTRIYLTSGGKTEVPDGYRGKHSPFAAKLLDALNNKGAAGKILMSSDLYAFVKKLPSGPMLGSFGDDEPGSEFVLLAK